MPTNLLSNPDFTTDVTTPGLADEWHVNNAVNHPTVTPPTMTLVPGGQRMVYAGEGTNTGIEEIDLDQDSEPTDFNPGQTATMYCTLSGTPVTGGYLSLILQANTAAYGWLGEVDGPPVVLTATPTQYVVSYPNLPAGTDNVIVSVVVASLTTSAVVDVTIGHAVLIAGDVVTVTGTIGPAANGAIAMLTPNGFGPAQTYIDQDGLLQITAEAVAPVTLPVVCDSNGHFSAIVFATDNTDAVSGPLPQGWTWGLTVKATPAAPAGIQPGTVLFSAKSFHVAHANGATQDLATILPVTSTPPGYPVTLAAETARAEAAEALRAPLDTGSATSTYITHDDAGWSYSGVPGAWVADQPEVGSYTGTCALAVANGAQAGYTFTDCAGITIIGHTGSDHGAFTVQLDGGTVDSWTAYSAGSVQQAVIASYPGLLFGTHSIVLTRTGGAYVEIDAAIVSSGVGIGIEFSGTGGVTVDGALHAAGDLSVTGGTYASNTHLFGELSLSPPGASTLIASAAAIGVTSASSVAVHGAAAITGLTLGTATRDGTTITIINTGAYSMTFAAAGTSNVADGVSCVIKALSSRTFVWDEATLLWYGSTGPAAEGDLTVSSLGVIIPTQAVLVNNDTIPSGAAVASATAAGNVTGLILAPGGTVTTVLNTDSSVTFAGTWLNWTNALALSGRWHYTDTGGDTATITFTGNKIEVYGNLSGNLGRATFAVDGGSPTTVSEYGAATLWHQLLFSSGTLSAGAHTLVITALGTHESASSDNNVGIDYWTVSTGTGAGTMMWVINESAYTMTFDASGTSNVADGASDVILAHTCRGYIWDPTTLLWYPVVS